MAKKSSQQSEVANRNSQDGAGALPAEVEEGAATAEKMVGGGLSIAVPIAPEVSGKYATGRIDIELPHHAVLMRRIQDALEARGEKCRGTGSVVNFLLNLVREADEKSKSRV